MQYSTVIGDGPTPLASPNGLLYKWAYLRYNENQCQKPILGATEFCGQSFEDHSKIHLALTSERQWHKALYEMWEGCSEPVFVVRLMRKSPGSKGRWTLRIQCLTLIVDF